MPQRQTILITQEVLFLSKITFTLKTNLIYNCNNSSYPKSVTDNIDNILSHEKIILTRLLDEIRKNLYSSSALNAVTRTAEKKVPLLKYRKYVTVLHDRSFFTKSEYSDNIYTMPFKTEYLKIYEKSADSKSNINLIRSENIDELTAGLSYADAFADKPYFVILLIDADKVTSGDITILRNKFPEYSFETAYNFFSLYRDASGFELDKSVVLDDGSFIEATAYSKQSGNCICGNSKLGDYIAIENNSWVCYSVNFYKKFTSFNVIASCGEISSASIEIRLDVADGRLIGECVISHTEKWGNFTRFSCSVENQQGIHDLYLVFKGADNIFLMNLTQFWFE